MKKALFIACIAALSLLGGCAFGGGSSDPGSSGGPGDAPACGDGKCDSADAPRPIPHRYVADMAKMNANWAGDSPMVTVADAYRVHVQVGPANIVAPTHIFDANGDGLFDDADINVIPYHNSDGVTDADGNPVARGDGVIAQYFLPGEIGFAIKHHRPQYRTLALTPGAGAGALKEHMKLQDTHIELVVGVMRDGQPGVVTLNNPQTYEGGRFGNADYSMIFVRPTYPEYLGADQERAFQDNIRTMMLGFNAVSDFPGDYNGGDPLAARNPAEVRNHAVMMIKAITGDEAARAWFHDPQNKIYCAELAFVSSTAGMLMPLNAETFVPLVGEETWNEFVRQVNAHNAGETTSFTSLNGNSFARLVTATLAPSDLRAAPEYAPAAQRAMADGQLAFVPMTMSDIVEEFMRTHMPRETLGEDLAPAQGALLEAMKPGLLEAMAMDTLAATDPRRVAVDRLFAAIVDVVKTNHGTYSAFRAALEPLLAQARMMTGPRDGSGTGLFVPPSLLHVVTKGRRSALLGLRYVGSGLHYSLVREAGTGPTTPTDPTTPTGRRELRVVSETLAEGAETAFDVDVPAGATNVRFEMTTTGDADLYVSAAAVPTQSTYDCRPYAGADQPEMCEFAPPASTYHAVVRGYSAATFRVVVTAE